MDERYTKKAMVEIWTYRRKYEWWLTACLAVLYAQWKVGDIIKKVYLTIKKFADFDVKRVHEIDGLIHQDAQAFIQAVKEKMREFGVPEDIIVYFANQITSYDMEDPAFCAQICQAVDLILTELQTTIDIFKRRAVEFEYLLFLACTHGQGANSLYFGIRICNWIDMLERARDRIKKARDEMAVAKFSGIIGVYGELSPEIEKIACRKMKLKPVRIATQIIHRDRHANLMNALSLCARNIDQIVETLWQMCHYPSCEAREYFDWINQRGSTGMPWKKNPWRLERLRGMACAMLGYEVMVNQIVPSPEERIMSGSSIERIAWPDGTTLTHFMVIETGVLFDKMEFFADNMQHNLEALQGVIFSQHVKDLLRKKGIFEMKFMFPAHFVEQLARQGYKMDYKYDADGTPYLVVETYDWVKYCTYLSWDMERNLSIKPFKDVLIEQGILRFISQQELDESFDLERGLAYAREIYDRFELRREEQQVAA